MSLIDKANELLSRWEKEVCTLPVPEDFPNNVLMCIADVIDEAKDEVQKLGLDPYDDFKDIAGNVESDLIKCILDHDEFLETLTSTYLTGSRYANDTKVKILAARIMSSAMNGINANAYFKEVEEDMIDLLYRWALADQEPLTSYAVEMLSYGETLCSRYHQNNMEVVSLLLQKLKGMYASAKSEYIAAHPTTTTIGSAPWSEDTQDGTETITSSPDIADNPLLDPTLVGRRNFEEFQCQAVLHFLLSLGEYQEFLGLIMKNSILKLLLNYISITDINSPIIFDIIRYLSALLCHKKFASDFMNYEGLQLLMDLPFNQRASTGISTCFYALVFHSTVMERLCSYTRHLIAPMMTTCLRLLKGKHESGRSHVTLFLTFGFHYQAIIEEFDKQCGLPIFFKVLRRAVDALKTPPENEVEVFLLRQKMKHTCNAVRQYLAGHTVLYAEHLRRVKDHQGVGMSPQIYTNHKALEIEDNIKTAYEYIQANAEFDTLWKPIDDVHSLGGFETFIQAFFLSETFRSTRYDASPCIITALTFLTILPRYQLKLTEQYQAPNGDSHTGIKMILQAAESFGNIDMQRAALSLIVVVVCGPYRASNMNLSMTPSQYSRKNSADDVMHKMWSAIRTNNGIKVLMSLLLTKTPINHADELRMAACKALNGLCRSRGVRQIASKLHLMSSGQLLALMREPILPENVETHSKFCTYTRSLLEVLFGVSTDKAANEPSLMNKMTKVDIVSKTPITFNKDEIYHLLHSSLLECGLKSTANALVDEVKQKLGKDLAVYPVKSEPQLPSTTHLMSPITPCKKLVIRNARSRVSSGCDPDVSSANLLSPSSIRPTTSKVPQKSFGVKDHMEALEAKTSQMYHPPSLNDLVYNFMRDQHMMCEHPMSIVPKFSLFREHKCPDPQPQLYEAPVNVVVRHQQRLYGVPYGGRNGRYRDYKYIFSKFKPYYTLRMDNRNAEDWENVNYTSCLTFSDYIVAGCNNGHIKVYKMTEHPPYFCVQTTESVECEPITSLVLSQSSKMMVSNSTGEGDVDRPNNSCTIWGVRDPGSSTEAGNSKDLLEQRHNIQGVDHAVFSYLSDDKLLCTMPEHKSSIVDCYTGRTVTVLANPPGSNGYYKNHAVFNFTDDLVLNDGVLWDYRTPTAIHKFDKFNNFVSGVFAPSGIDIIINTEVWDMRTFKLLNTINSLDNCLLKYNHSKDVMYGLSHVKQEILDHEISPSYKHVMGPFESTFKTFAANSGYPSLGTYDVGKQIVDLNFCRRDRLLVTVESTNEEFTQLWSGGSVVKLYLVGRSKASRDDDEEEEDEEEDDDDEDDDEDDSVDNSEFDDDEGSPNSSQVTSQPTSHVSTSQNTLQSSDSETLSPEMTSSQNYWPEHALTSSQNHSPSSTSTSDSSSTEVGSLMSEEMNDRSSNSSMSNDDEDEDEDNDSSGNPRTSLNFSVMSDSDDDHTQGRIV